MLVLLDGLILGLVFGVLAGGRFSRMATFSFRFDTLLSVTLPVHVLLPVVARPLGLTQPEFITLWLFIAALLASISLLNSRHIGMLLIGLGLSLNVLVVAANGAMPVDIGDRSVSAALDIAKSPLHELATDKTRLPALGDWIAVPGPKWHRGLASIGDLLASVGAGVLVFTIMRSTGPGDA